MRYIVLLMLVLGCASKEKVKPTSNIDLALEEKAEVYCEMSRVLEDRHGFVGRCGDQVLFNSLRLVSCPKITTNLFLAENPDKPGQWFRDGDRSCHARGETATQDSRDMLLGRMLYLWQLGDSEALAAVERIISYLKAHDWYLCEAKEPLRTSRCKVNPGLKSTLYELVYQLGGENNPARQFEPIFGPVKGYEAHLAVLHITLRGMMKGSITHFQKEALKYQKNRQPKNLLFKTAYAKFDDGRMDGIVRELKAMDHLFPNERLPTSKDRCEPYIWQRDSKGGDWAPCDGELKKHPGIDLAFLVALINDKIRVSKGLVTPEGNSPYRERD